MPSGTATGAAAGSWFGPLGTLTGGAIGAVGDVISGLFSSSAASKNRKWQEKMSNTAHQREVTDLKAAGLNPALSAMKGNGASTPSGDMARVPDFGRAGDRVQQGQINTAQRAQIASNIGLQKTASYKNEAEGDLALQSARESAARQLEIEMRTPNQNYMDTRWAHLADKDAAELQEIQQRIRIGNVDASDRTRMAALERNKSELFQQLEHLKIPRAQLEAAYNSGDFAKYMEYIRAGTGAVGDVTGGISNIWGLGAVLNSAKKGSGRLPPGGGVVRYPSSPSGGRWSADGRRLADFDVNTKTGEITDRKRKR